MQDNKIEEKTKKPAPKWSGFFIASWFWIVGIIFFITPKYIGFSGIGETILVIFGWIALVISFVGALLELSKIYNNEAFKYVGVSLFFLIPSILMYLYIQNNVITRGWAISIKILTILLVIVGSGILLYGISYFFESSPNERSVVEPKRPSSSKTKFEFFSSIIVAILSLTTALLQLLGKIGN